MRKIFLFGVISIISLTAMAKIRTADEAAIVAQQFESTVVNTNRGRLANSPLRLVYTIEQPTATPAAYVFGGGENDGFVIVSANDWSRSVLGYTTDGTWNSDSMPDNMRAWMQHYAEEIAAIQQCDSIPINDEEYTVLGKQLTPAIDSLLQKTGNAPSRHLPTATAVQPILGNIVWGQETPFNNNCPIDPSNSTAHCHTGCVATAAAQIMRFWQHPTSGTGSHSYYWSRGGKTLSASFSHTYNWSSMPASYKTYNSTQASAVAKLMSDVGIAADMEYGGKSAGGSSAKMNVVAAAMQKYFGYDKSMLCISQDYLGEQVFEKQVEEEIRSGRPLLIHGFKTAGDGHCFVVDGIDANGYFHINWGWDGSKNGYFVLSALDPNKPQASGKNSKDGYCLSPKKVDSQK